MTLKSNAAGQYIIDVLDFPKNDTAIEANAVAAQEEPQDEVPMPAEVINPSLVLLIIPVTNVIPMRW